ncbi:hypothetical protein [Cellulomonas sp. IC4_254]|uniref:hypothetical protein n=1 Tax=Cellulomonas sp. IC4_254 TaxID=2714040 RepID=UPI00141E4FBA|nr:hypothetical protein [Cellulomonas sp. IC4_254]NHT16691.1 hypothetical protein [Cellulomonas sp. IC4_254]
MTSDDAYEDFLAAYRTARPARDYAVMVDVGTVLARRTAIAVLEALGTPVKESASTVALVHHAGVEEVERVGRLDRTQPWPPRELLPRLYRAIWWLSRSDETARVDGTLRADAPYRDLGHLLRCLMNDARQLLAACPSTAVAPDPAYVRVSWSGTGLPSAGFPVDEPDEEQAEEWWCAAHELVEIEPAAWKPFVVALEHEGTEWPDMVQVPDLELVVYSDRFRDAVEAARRDGDTHGWLAVGVHRAGEARTYAVLNVWGAAGASVHGMEERLAGDRTVVLPGPGGGEPVFAARARAAVDAAGIALPWKTVE